MAVQHDVFISYATPDKNTADTICHFLEAEGVRCWIAPRDIPPGGKWPTHIPPAVEASRLMVLVFSESANTSDSVQKEIVFAANFHLTIIALRIEDVVPKGGLALYLAKQQWIDALTAPLSTHVQSFVKGLCLVLAACESHEVECTTDAGRLSLCISVLEGTIAGIPTAPVGAAVAGAAEMSPTGTVACCRTGLFGVGVAVCAGAAGVLGTVVTSPLRFAGKVLDILRSKPRTGDTFAKAESGASHYEQRECKQNAEILKQDMAAEGTAVVRRETDANAGGPDNPEEYVSCSIFAPPEVEVGHSFLVQTYTHLVEQAARAAVLAKTFDADAECRAAKSLEIPISRGTQLAFELVVPGLNVDPPVQSLVWRGNPEAVQFSVEVPRECSQRTIIGTVKVFCASVPIAHIKFVTKIVPARSSLPAAEPKAAGSEARFYERAFISYASANRPEVLRRVQMLTALGIRYRVDLLDLEPGVQWERKLYEYIEESDLFLLFWSNAAKESEWVYNEVKYALERKNGDDYAPPEIQPIILEGPPVPTPWKELAHIHFSDKLAFVLQHADAHGKYRG